MSNDLREPPVPKLPIDRMGTVRVEKPDASAFVHVWACCPCCGKRMAVWLQAANNLIAATAYHQTEARP